MTCISFYIICWFVKVSDPWYMIFAMFAQNSAISIDDYSCIPNNVSLTFITLQNWWYDDDTIFFTQLKWRQIWKAPIICIQETIKKYTFCKNLVVGPVSADSANSHHGCFSRVQKAKGISAIKFIIHDFILKRSTIKIKRTYSKLPANKLHLLLPLLQLLSYFQYDHTGHFFGPVRCPLWVKQFGSELNRF